MLALPKSDAAADTRVCIGTITTTAIALQLAWLRPEQLASAEPAGNGAERRAHTDGCLTPAIFFFYA